MSIEALLTRLAEALEANTESLQALMKDSAKGTTKAPAKGTTKAADKPASGKTTTTKGETSVDDVAARVGAFLKTGTKDERETRKAQAKQIIEHFGAERFTLIDADKFDEALGYLDQFEAGEDPFGGDGADEDDENMV